MMPAYLVTEYDADGNPIPVMRYSSLMPGLGYDCEEQRIADTGNPLAAAENREFLVKMSSGGDS